MVFKFFSWVGLTEPLPRPSRDPSSVRVSLEIKGRFVPSTWALPSILGRLAPSIRVPPQLYVNKISMGLIDTHKTNEVQKRGLKQILTFKCGPVDVKVPFISLRIRPTRYTSSLWQAIHSSSRLRGKHLQFGRVVNRVILKLV